MKKPANTKLYPNLVRAVVSALQTIFEEGQYADKVIQQTLKSNPKWGSRDRAFIAEHVYDIVRWYRLLYTLAGGEARTSEDWWRIFGIHRIVQNEPLPSWQEFQDLDAEDIRKEYRRLQSDRKIRESVPDWLDERGEAELGGEWEPSLQALNRPASVVLRVNTLKTTADKLAGQLAKDGIYTEKIDDTALLITERRNLFATQAFRDGLFEIQDYSSQQVAPFLGVEAGMQVIDACAGGGGKSLHLATLMENRGALIALDTAEWKLKELQKRARRNGIHIIQTRPITSTKVIKRLRERADRLLLDVPCSGLGVLRRNPDAKWKLSPEFMDRVRAEQRKILDSYHRMLKPGGEMVYATCSILPSENRRQVDFFLSQHPDYELMDERVILPQDKGYDGFYMAKLKKQS